MAGIRFALAVWARPKSKQNHAVFYLRLRCTETSKPHSLPPRSWHRGRCTLFGLFGLFPPQEKVQTAHGSHATITDTYKHFSFSGFISRRWHDLSFSSESVINHCCKNKLFSDLTRHRLMFGKASAEKNTVIVKERVKGSQLLLGTV